MTKQKHKVLAAAATLLMFAPPAFAYLDPSTGSMILSAIVGLFATAALAVKTYWYKIKAFFRAGRDDGRVPVEEQAPEAESPRES
jgi:hypothetical protein